MDEHMKKVLFLSVLALSISTSLIGCGGKTPEQHIESAQQFIQTKDPAAAVVELKSAIQQAPDNAQARLLLGRIYLSIGEGVAADKELTRALKNGAKLSDMAIDLARAAYLSGVAPSVALNVDNQQQSNTQEIIKFYELLTRFDNAELTNLATDFSTFSQNSNDSATKAAADAVIALLNQQNSQAISHLQKVPTDSPIYWDTQLLLAKAQLTEGLFSEATTTLKGYVAVATAANFAKLMLAETYVRNNKIAEAEPILAGLLALYPDQPLANYLKAVISYEQKNFVAAKELAERALNNGFTPPNVRILAALSALQQNLNAQALAHLRIIKEQLKAYPAVEKTYAFLELQQGNIADGTDLLTTSPAGNEDLAILTSASFELIKQGAAEQATQVVQHLEKSVDKNVENLATLSMLKMGLGQVAEGTNLLEQAVSLDPSDDKNQLVLAIAYINTQEIEKARALATNLLKVEKSKVLGHTISAYVALSQGDKNGVNQSAQQILALEPNNLIAIIMQARIAAANGDINLLNQKIQKALSIDPSYYSALEMDYEFNKVEPAATAAKDRISAALTRDPANLSLTVLQARVLFEQRDVDQVIALLANVKTSPEQRPNIYWHLLINSYKAKKQNKNALESALSWRNSQPQNLAAQINYIAALIENRQFEEALKLTQLQLKMHPNVPELKNMAAVLQAETKDYAGAITSLNLLPKETQQKPEVMLLKGKLLMSQGKYMEAKTAVLASYQQNKSAQTAMYIADMVAKNETPEAAVRFIENHFSTEPKHPLLQSMYANLLLAVDPNKASSTYTSLINEDPENFMALNNLAYLYSEQGKPDEALQYVEKALKLEPNHPDALDTMGRVMLLKGNVDDALKYFEQSLKIRPEHPDVSLNYAEALIMQGNKEKAKSILSNIQVNDPMLLKKSKRISELL